MDKQPEVSSKIRPELAKAMMQTRTANVNLIIAVSASVINLLMLCFGGPLYFPFSVYSPYLVAVLGDLYYRPVNYGLEFASVGITPFIVGVVIGVVIIAMFALCGFMSRPGKVIKSGKGLSRSRGWMIAALVLYSADVLAFVPRFLLFEFSFGFIVDLAFHAWVIYYLVLGVNAFKKWARINEQELIDDAKAKYYEKSSASGSAPDDIIVVDGADICCGAKSGADAAHDEQARGDE